MKKICNKSIPFFYGIFFLILFFTLIDCLSVSAQTITISGVLRPRFEVQYGYRVAPDSGTVPQFLLSQRTRLNAAYNSERFGAFLSLQDARVFGDELQATDLPSFGLHEAWAQYNFNKKIGVRVGRQELKYDNKRLLTDGDWPQQGRAHDGILLKASPSPGWKVDLFGSYNQQTQAYFGNYYALSNYKTLEFLWVNKSKFDSLSGAYNISALVMADGYQTPDTTGVNFRFTYGINGTYDRFRWGINFEGYGQNGETRKVNQSGITIQDTFQTVNAYMFSLNPWVEVAKNFQVGVGLDYLSGSDALDTSSTSITNMFNPQYGAADKFYGKIDIFTNLPADTRNGGLIDGYLSLKYNLKGWNLSAVYHYFQLQNQVEDVENKGQPLEKGLGSEFDFAVLKDITKDINLNGGVAIYLPTRSMEFVKSLSFSQIGGPEITAYYIYLMLTFKPVFFSK